MAEVYFYFGLLSVFVGSVFSAVGMNLLKASSKVEKTRPLHRRWRFLLGIFLTTVVNTSLDAYAFAFVPVSVIAPFGGVCVVTSALIAYKGCITERELLDRLQWTCLLAIMGGVSLVGTFGPRPLPVTNATVILEGFEKPSFVVYQAVWGGTNLCAFALRFFRILKVQTLKETLLFGVSAGMSSGVTQCLMKALASMTAGEAIVGDSDTPVSPRSRDDSSVAASESTPASISGTSAVRPHEGAPVSSRTTRSTNASMWVLRCAGASGASE